MAILGDIRRKPTMTEWPTPAELKEFDALREAGTLSYFREAPCAGKKDDGTPCERPIPRSFKFCSPKCAGVTEALVTDEDDGDYEED